MRDALNFLIGMFVIAILLIMSSYVHAAGLADLKFGQAQIADSQWNVSACMYTSTCQIYAKSPGTAYKIPWTSGQVPWGSYPGSYIKLEANIVSGVQNTTNPWKMNHYTSSGTLIGSYGIGHIINMGTGYFFFVGSDNNTGQLFSMSTGMSGSSGLTWTGTLNPTIAQTNTTATQYGSTVPLASGQTYTAVPSLCCGGSAASFSANSANTTKVQTFVARTTADSQVHVEQIGNGNTTVIEQTGTKNNYVKYYVSGNSNNATITQYGNSSTQVDYIDLKVTGNSNNSTLTQTSTGGAKGIFATVADGNNNLKVTQSGSGSHYADVNLSGGSKSVDINQSGTANHMASVTLSGQPTSLNLTQSGSTQQFYSITHNCATAGGCSAITVTQGQ